MNSKWALLVSLAIHFLLFFNSIFSFSPPPPRSRENIEIELKATPQQASNSREKTLVPKQNRQYALTKKLLNSANFGLNFSLASKANLSASGSWREGAYNKSDDPNVAWGAGGGTFERIQDWRLMKHIHDRVDGLLFYPGVLARRKMTGVVNTRLVINKLGSCEWPLTKIEAANPYFRVYTLHLLKKLCSENFKNVLDDRQLSNVDMTFHFELTEGKRTIDEIADRQYVLGNVLSFYRNTQDSIAEWHLGPFTGVFPIPLVNLDFEWIFENFDKYVNNKDPLGDYRSKSL